MIFLGYAMHPNRAERKRRNIISRSSICISKAKFKG
jgi:hypothetical protein